MTIKQKIANKEVLIVLSKLNLINKIPKDIILSMQNNQDKDWNFVYNDSLPLDKQRLTRQSILMFSNLYYMYICEDNAEKEKMKAIIQENERKANEEMKAKLNNLNGKSSVVSSSKTEESKQNDNQLVKPEKISFIQMIINKIRRFFKK